MTNKVVYLHSRNDTNSIFYVGIGSVKRAYSKAGRNHWWRRVTGKTPFSVHILCNGLTSQEAKQMEITLIKGYKAQGIELCNLTDGGDGRLGGTQTKEVIERHIAFMRGNTYGLGIPVKEPIIGVNLKTGETVKFIGRKSIVNHGVFDARSVYRCANKDTITATFAKGIHRGFKFYWESEYLRKVGN